MQIDNFIPWRAAVAAPSSYSLAENSQTTAEGFNYYTGYTGSYYSGESDIRGSPTRALRDGKTIFHHGHERVGLDPHLERTAGGEPNLGFDDPLHPKSIFGATRIPKVDMGADKVSKEMQVKPAGPVYEIKYSQTDKGQMYVRFPRESSVETKSERLARVARNKAEGRFESSLAKASTRRDMVLERNRQLKSEQSTAGPQKRGKTNGVRLLKRSDRWGQDPSFATDSYDNQRKPSLDALLRPSALSKKVKANVFHNMLTVPQKHRTREVGSLVSLRLKLYPPSALQHSEIHASEQRSQHSGWEGGGGGRGGS
jgi:hypothetical protein